MSIYFTELDTPLCPLRLTSEGDALTGLYLLPDHRHAPDPTDAWLRDDTLPVFRDAAEQLDAYFAGTRTRFDLPLRAEGTAFQQAVWAALATIPYGATLSYGALAAQLGRPGAARAVGLANGRNPLSIVVPCHRVVGAGGKLTGYGGGLARKKALLEWEGRLAAKGV